MENKSQEIDKESKIIDMMLTAHSHIRDTNSFRATAMDIFLFISSIILNATVFLDPSILAYLGVNSEKARLIIGLSSIIIFILSFITLRVDWKQKSENYKQSAETLSQLKSQCIELKNINDDIKYQEKMKNIKDAISKLPVKIPENEFLKLKALHKRKIELSEMIDKNPGASIFLMKTIMCFKANYNIFKSRRNGEENEKL